MTRISEEHRFIFEQSVFLPMVLTVLSRDLDIINTAPFKLKKPYANLIDQTMRKVQKDLYQIKVKMKEEKMKAMQLERDEAFTLFLFIINGWEEKHNYFNPRIRTEVSKLLEKYLSGSNYYSESNP
ncbi:hypothetical protein [Bacillus sp. PS06]|uniref:hypothetical protein n=1 Tax=Bacillus sp. PS06 TaxID=2764176 RepID=UPI001781C2CA|nr:hypothetical protein [Bacillus sp. PS06]MBD8067610.1 hypothetical protein [Bacillus sp. PS06]